MAHKISRCSGTVHTLSLMFNSDHGQKDMPNKISPQNKVCVQGLSTSNEILSTLR